MIAFTLDNILTFQDWIAWIIIAEIVEVFFFPLVYIFGRTLWWAYLINGVFTVEPLPPEELTLEKGTKATLLVQIHNASINYARSKTEERLSMRFADFFSRTRLCLRKLAMAWLLIAVVTPYLVWVIYLVKIHVC